MIIHSKPRGNAVEKKNESKSDKITEKKVERKSKTIKKVSEPVILPMEEDTEKILLDLIN